MRLGLYLFVSGADISFVSSAGSLYFFVLTSKTSRHLEQRTLLTMVSEDSKAEEVDEGMPKDSPEATEDQAEPKETEEVKEASEVRDDAQADQKTSETKEHRGKKEFEGDIEIDDDGVALTFPQRVSPLHYPS